jgi:hypothetical protein
MTVFDKLLEPVLPILEEIEQTRRKHGNETLTWLTSKRLSKNSAPFYAV